MRLTKRHKANEEAFEPKKEYPLAQAVKILKNIPAKAKFDETVELAVKLNITQKQAPQPIRGTVSLPHGSGKKVRIAVFTKTDHDKAKAAGADYVGDDELIQKVAGGWCEFDVAIATPQMMAQMSKLGKVLGPKGLMPSPKAGTITQDVAGAVEAIQKGKIEFRMDKQANINVRAGKLSFDEKSVAENIAAIYREIIKTRPDSVKGHYIQSAHISSTMGPGIKLDLVAFESTN